MFQQCNLVCTWELLQRENEFIFRQFLTDQKVSHGFKCKLEPQLTWRHQ